MRAWQADELLRRLYVARMPKAIRQRVDGSKHFTKPYFSGYEITTSRKIFSMQHLCNHKVLARELMFILSFRTDSSYTVA